MQGTPLNWYFWVFLLSGLLGVLCIILAVITGLVGQTIVLAKASTLIQAAIALFIFSIGVLLFEIRNHVVRSR